MMADAQLPSLDDLLKEVSPAALKRPFTDEHLRNLALSISDWKALAPFLELDEVEERSTSPLRRRIAVLRKWQEKCALRGRTASYKKLAKVFWKLGRADLVEEVGRAAAEEKNDLESSSDEEKDAEEEETGPKSTGSADHTSAVDRYAVRLKKVYRKYMFEMADEWPPRVSDQYVNLALINHKKIMQPDEMNEFAKSTLHGTVDDLYFEKEAITLEHLFKTESVLQGGSLHLRRQFLTSSIDRQFEGILKGLPSMTDRVQQVDDLLKNITTTLDISRSIMSQPLTMVQNPKMSSLPNEKGLKVLLDGAPGVGKTTMCHKACKDWAQGKAFTDFRLMVYVPLREDQVARATKVEHLFCFGTLHSRKQLAHELEDTDGEGVLFVFDGWDELSPQQRGKASLFCRVILRKVLPLCSILITSRPYASQWLRKPDVTNRHVEILGLTEQQVEQCIRDRLEEIPHAAKALLEKLAVRRDLKTLCYVPMNLAMVLYIYTTRLELPDTLTRVYDLFTINALLRYLKDYDPSTEPIMELKNRDDLPPLVKEMYQALCSIAYDGLLQDKVVFSKSDLQDYHPKLLANSNTLGLVTATKSFAETGVKTKYQFLHLTIQEFLAADALSKQPAEIQTKFVIDHLSHTRFRTMFRFLFGLCHLESIKDILCFLFATSVNGRNPEWLLFLCHMLYEMHDTKFYRAISGDMEPNPIELEFPDELTLFDVLVIGKFLAHSSVTIKCLDLYDADLTRQKLALLTESISTDDPKVAVEQLHLRTVKSSIIEVAPFIHHPIFNNTLYLKIDLPTAPPMASMFCSCIIAMPSLTSVHLSLRDPSLGDKAILPSAQGDMVSTVEIVFTMLSQNRRITSLTLRAILGNDPDLLGNECGRSLVEMLASREAPMSLEINTALFSKPFVDALSNSIATSSKIKAIQLWENSPCFKRSSGYEGYLTATGAQALFTAMKTNTSIESLKLKCKRPLFTDPQVATALQEMLSTNSTLKTLAMESCGIDPAAASALASTLSCNKTLTELRLVRDQVEIETILLSVASNSFSALQKLVLQSCQLGDEDEHCISTLLECSTTLKVLDLRYNQLGSATAIGLFAVLHDNATLEELSLCRNKLGVGNVEALSSTIQGALSNNRTLKVLRLNENCLPRLVIEAIANALAGGSALQVLKLQHNGVDLIAVRKLCVALQANSCLKELCMSEDVPFDSDTIDHLNQMVIANNTLTSLTMKFGEADTITNNTAMLAMIERLVKALHRNTTLTKVLINGLGSEFLDPINFSRTQQQHQLIHHH